MTPRPRRKTADTPLLRALTWAGLGFPAEVWATIATVLAPARVTYTAADVAAFAAAHPQSVVRIDGNSGPRYRRGDDHRTSAALGEPSIVRALDSVLGPDRREDDIAVALVAQYAAATDENVRSYLRRTLPDWCADGTGGGLAALRALPADPDIDRMLGKALLLRADRETGPTARTMRDEAVQRLTAAGEAGEAAEALRATAGGLRSAGETEAALRAMTQAVAIYQVLRGRNDFYDRFLALTLLDIGLLHRDAGRRRAARAATRQAYDLFRRIAAEDHRFLDEVELARRQLKQLRWPF